MPRALRIGLTGGIGSGKSTVAARLAAHGATVVDTDAISRALTAPGGAALPEIAQAFGPQMLTFDGALDRDRMRALVFTDADARQRLEAILHPRIGAEALRQAAAGGPVVVFDVPLLTESGHWRARVDRILVVDCPEDTQARRVAQRPGWDEATARRVIAQQAPRARRRAIADAVLANGERPLARLHDDVDRLWALWTAAPVEQ
jgi:dephospho-CoA kinase